MYNSFFGLERNPFSLTPDPNFLYMTAEYREALAGLLFAITCRKGFSVLTGDAGTGKTTLLRTVLRSVSPDRTLFSFVTHPTLTAAEFLEYTLLDFGLTDLPESKAQRLVLFREFLIRSHQTGRIPVLVVDEAQRLSFELLEEIRLLTNAETADHKLLQIILAGQNELSDILARENMRQLRQRISVRVSIGALKGPEIRQYMETRWSRASAKHPFPFSDDAVSEIAHHSQGIPRLINSLCDAVLTSAFGSGLRAVDMERVQLVARDLFFATAVRPKPNPTPAVAPPPQPEPALVAAAPRPEAVDAPLAFPALERYSPTPAKHTRVSRWMTRLGFGGA